MAEILVNRVLERSVVLLAIMFDTPRPVWVVPASEDEASIVFCLKDNKARWGLHNVVDLRWSPIIGQDDVVQRVKL